MASPPSPGMRTARRHPARQRPDFITLAGFSRQRQDQVHPDVLARMELTTTLWQPLRALDRGRVNETGRYAAAQSSPDPAQGLAVIRRRSWVQAAATLSPRILRRASKTALQTAFRFVPRRPRPRRIRAGPAVSPVRRKVLHRMLPPVAVTPLPGGAVRRRRP